MNKRMIPGVSLIGLLAVCLLLAGCSNGTDDKAAKAESAAPAEQPATAEHPATTEHPATAEHPAAQAGAARVAVHDCAGECGMKDVPEDQLTEIEGKWYCSVCAEKLQADGEGHTGG